MNDKKSLNQSLEPEQAMEMIFSKVTVVGEERVPLGMAREAILREPICADQAMPPFNRSAMDGYAVVREDISESLMIIEEILTGKSPVERIQEGLCSRIFTGGMIPEGANQVIPQEMVERKGNQIRILERPKSSFIRYQGEDCQKGVILLKSGDRLGAVEQSILAGVGAVFPLVSIPVRVLHFSSGNEIVSPEIIPTRGQIRNTNSILMESLLSESGARIVHQGHLPEDFERAMELIRPWESEEVDLLLISGGASVGDHDYSRKIFNELGYELVFESLNLRPGKPLVFGVKGRKLCFAIPGNPVSHFVIFHRFLKLLISKMEGGKADLNWREGILTEELEGGGNKRNTLWPLGVEWREENYRITPLKWNSSGDMRGLLGCGGLLDMRAGVERVEAGSKMQFIKIS